MNNLLIIAPGFWIAGLISIAYGVYALRRAQVTTRVEKVLSQGSTTQMPSARALEKQIVTGSFFSRTLVPALENLFRFAGRFTPANSIQRTAQLLAVAGNPLNLQPTTFYGLRITLLFAGAALAAFILRFSRASTVQTVILAYGIIVFFYMFPSIWLNRLANTRRQAIRQELPDALDLLSVLASAGFNLNQALARISEQWTTVLSQEFGRVISELEIGLSLDDALKNFAARVDVAEISSFVAVVIQANRLGIKIADVLQTQAEQMRVLRQFRAKELAQRMPARMMVPLAFFILPSLIYILLVPAFISISSTFSQ